MTDHDAALTEVSERYSVEIQSIISNGRPHLVAAVIRCACLEYHVAAISEWAKRNMSGATKENL